MSDISLQSATEIAITDTTLIPAQPTGGVWSKITGLGIKTYLQSLFDSKVSTTGNETIAGVKTFSSSPIVPTPVSGTQASNKDYSDTLNPDFYQYSIVRTVDGSGNLTVALKNYEGNDPTPTKPVKIMIGGVIRTITGALSQTMNAGTNYLNLGSAELATKEVDLFPYLVWDSVNLVVKLFYARIPNATKIGDFVFNFTDEKGVNGTFLNGTSTDQVVNIGRFNATLSAGPGYTWSIPATSVIINRPIFETKVLGWTPTLTWYGIAPTGGTNLTYTYQIIGSKCYIRGSGYNMTPGVGNTGILVTLPFVAIGGPSRLALINSRIGVSDTPNISMGEINYNSDSLTIKCTSVNATYFQFQGFYDI